MNKIKLFTTFLFILPLFSFAQNPVTGTKSWNDANMLRNNSANVLNGNDTLTAIFDTTACGLNYTQATLKLGQRLSPAGATQPAPFTISGIPAGAQILKAYLWCAGAGNGVATTATVTNPASATSTFTMNIIGQAADMCWGYAGTYVYRADVTSSITSNGDYFISGIPTNPPDTMNDMDGATLLIIYRDYYVSYTGSIHIDDGAVVMAGDTANYMMTGFNSCATASVGNAFMIVADLQNLGSTFSMNGGALLSVTDDWFNYISDPTYISQGQTGCNFTINSNGDCYCLLAAGLYSQTNCNTCIASVPESELLSGSMKLIPNPTNGLLSVSFSLLSAEEVSVQIFDTPGKLVFSKDEKGTKGKFTTTLDLSSLSAGVYFVKISTSQGFATQRLIIE